MPGWDARCPWQLGGSGDGLYIEVGPVDGTGDSLREALSLYHRLLEELANQLPADAVLRSVSGPRLQLPVAPLSPEGLRRVAALATPVASRWLTHADAGNAELCWSPGGLEIEFSRRPVPESFDLLVEGVAWLFLGLVREHLRPGPSSAPLAEERRSGSVIYADARSDGAGALWAQLAPELARRLRKPVYETLHRWLDLPALAPAPLPAEAPRETTRVDDLPADDLAAGIRIIPFHSGGRPLDELEEPGTGCSEPAGFVRSGSGGVGNDQMWLMFQLSELAELPPGANIEVRASAWFLPHPGENGDAVPVPAFDGIVPPRKVASLGPDGPRYAPAQYVAGAIDGYVFPIVPQLAFFPSEHERGWTWEQAPRALRDRVPDGTDPYTFGSFFHQRIRIELTLAVDGRDISRSGYTIKIYDLDRFGSLYGRLLDLVGQDTAQQAKDLGESGVYPGHHPWYPVLGIGMNKASFYMRAIIDDSRTQSCHLANPWWLLDVGLWLEYLTCVGVFETVRDTHPDMLSATERRLLEEAPRFFEVRTRINPKRWSEVWGPRKILPKGYSPLAAGPVSFLNLMKKQEGTLRFLEAHHEDLVHAVDLAGPNLVSSQEAWHRVYRDAERAVTNSSLAAFPELRHVPPAYREFALWHEKGDFSRLPGGFLLPKSVTAALGDQDGIYPSAARQYRASMNHVAQICRSKGLMEYAGAEAVPREVSLIEALIEKDDQRFKVLQARDGYGGSLTAVSQTLTPRVTPGRKSMRELFRVHPLFESLQEDELEALADAARVVHAVPTEAIVTQGEDGNSMFLLESGRLDVEITGADGVVRLVRTMVPGEYLGEMALLTGEKRSATVRARDYPTLVELSSEHIRPFIEARSEILEAMSETAAARAERRVSGSDAVSRKEMARRMRAHLFQEPEGSDEIVVQESVLDLLRRLPLLSPLSQEEVAALAERAECRTVAGGTIIVRQDSRGSSLFAVLAGRVAVYHVHRGKRRKIGTIADGEVFGEMALMTGERRSADVQADGDCTVVEISRSDFLPVMTRRPSLVVALSEILDRRAAEREASGVTAALHGVAPAAGNSQGLRRRVRSFFFG